MCSTCETGGARAAAREVAGAATARQARVVPPRRAHAHLARVRGVRFAGELDKGKARRPARNLVLGNGQRHQRARLRKELPQQRLGHHRAAVAAAASAAVQPADKTRRVHVALVRAVASASHERRVETLPAAAAARTARDAKRLLACLLVT